MLYLYILVFIGFVTSFVAIFRERQKLKSAVSLLKVISICELAPDGLAEHFKGFRSEKLIDLALLPQQLRHDLLNLLDAVLSEIYGAPKGVLDRATSERISACLQSLRFYRDSLEMLVANKSLAEDEEKGRNLLLRLDWAIAGVLNTEEWKKLKLEKYVKRYSAVRI